MSYKYIFVPSDNGLHCLNLENGQEIWKFIDPYSYNLRCRTPAIDQINGYAYLQMNNRFFKIDIRTGTQISTAVVVGQVYSGNTVLVNDANGYYLLTYYSDWLPYGGKLFCYNADLTLRWSITGLNSSQKNSICYHNGIVYFGTGENYAQGQEIWYIGQLEDCRVNAYNITDGSPAWTTILSNPVGKIFEAGGYGINSLIYVNGYIIADKRSSLPTRNTFLYLLDAATGAIVRTLDCGGEYSACGLRSFSYGRYYMGDLVTNSLRVYQFGTGNKTNFYPFGTAQVNTCEADPNSLTAIDPTITFIGNVPNGDQGSIVYNQNVYCCYGAGSIGIVSFDCQTLAFIRQYSIYETWDSSPLIVQNNAGTDLIIAHNYILQQSFCRKLSDNSLVWESLKDQTGNLIYGLNYYILPTDKTRIIIFSAANLAALKVLIDNWLLIQKIVINIHINNAGTQAVIIYYL